MAIFGLHLPEQHQSQFAYSVGTSTSAGKQRQFAGVVSRTSKASAAGAAGMTAAEAKMAEVNGAPPSVAVIATGDDQAGRRTSTAA